MFRQVLVLLTVMSVALAGIAISNLEEKPEEYKDRAGCWVSDINQFIPLGETRSSPTECWGYECFESHVKGTTCGSSAVLPPCTLTEDKSLPFPQCCPQAQCPPEQ